MNPEKPGSHVPPSPNTPSPVPVPRRVSCRGVAWGGAGWPVSLLVVVLAGAVVAAGVGGLVAGGYVGQHSGGGRSLPSCLDLVVNTTSGGEVEVHSGSESGSATSRTGAALCLAQGSEVFLSAVPSRGFQWAGWVVGSRSSSEQITVFLNDSQTYQASFVPSPTVPTPEAFSSSGRLADAVDGGRVFHLESQPTGVLGSATFQWKGLPTGNCSGVNTSEVTCTAPVVASQMAYVVTLTVVDNGANFTSPPLNLTIYPPLTVRMTASASAIDASQGVSFEAQPKGGASPYTTTWVEHPPGCTEVGSASLSCNDLTLGNYSLETTTEDSDGSWKNSTLNYTVDPLPSLGPIKVSRPSLDLGEGTNLSVTARYTGYGSIEWTGLPPGCSSANITKLACTPSSPGTFSVSATLTDGRANVSSFPVLLTVAPTLEGGPISSSRNVSDTGEEILFSATYTGGGGIPTYSWSTTLSGCLPNNSPTLSCTPLIPGVYLVSVTIHDANGEVVNESTNVVVEPWPSGVTVKATTTALDVGEATYLNASFTVSGPVNLTWTGLPTGCDGANFSTILCVPTLAGTFTVVLVVRDTHGGTASSSPLLIVVSPRLTGGGLSTSRSTLDANMSVTFTLALSGGSGGDQFTWAGLPAGCISTNAPSLTCNPSTWGTFVVTLVATDTNGVSISANTTILVSRDPFIGVPSLSPGAVDMGESLHVNVDAVAYALPATLAWSGMPAGCASTMANFTCIPTAVGVYTLSAVLTDVNGYLIGSPSVSLVVSPSLGITGIVTNRSHLDTSQPLEMQMMGTTGGALPYTYTWSGLPPGCTSLDSVNLTCVPSAAGNFTVKAQLMDANGQSTKASLAISVSTFPKLGPVVLSQNRMDVGQVLNISVEYAPGSSAATYAWADLPEGCTPINSPALSCTMSSAGNWTISASATDSNNGKVASVAPPVEVYPLLQPPVLSASRTTLDVGQTSMLTAKISGGSDGYSYVWEGLPEGCAPLDSPFISCTPAISGDFDITLSVKDSDGSSVSTGILLEVSTAPIIETPVAAPSDLEVGQALRVAASTSGGAGALVYFWQGLPVGCPEVDAPSFTCSPVTPGAYELALTVNDTNSNNQTSPALLLSIQPALTAVTLTIVPSTIVQGETAYMIANVTGGSGVYKFSYTGLPANCVSANRSVLACTPSSSGASSVVVSVQDTLGASESSIAATLNVQGAMQVTNIGPRVLDVNLSAATQNMVTLTGRNLSYTGEVTFVNRSGVLTSVECATPGACSLVNSTTLDVYPGTALAGIVNASASNQYQRASTSPCNAGSPVAVSNCTSALAMQPTSSKSAPICAGPFSLPSISTDGFAEVGYDKGGGSASLKLSGSADASASITQICVTLSGFSVEQVSIQLTEGESFSLSAVASGALTTDNLDSPDVLAVYYGPFFCLGLACFLTTVSPVLTYQAIASASASLGVSQGESATQTYMWTPTSGWTAQNSITCTNGGSASSYCITTSADAQVQAQLEARLGLQISFLLWGVAGVEAQPFFYSDLDVGAQAGSGSASETCGGLLGTTYTLGNQAVWGGACAGIGISAGLTASLFGWDAQDYSPLNEKLYGTPLAATTGISYTANGVSGSTSPAGGAATLTVPEGTKISLSSMDAISPAPEGGGDVWTDTGGTLSAPSGSSVIWTAPMTPGTIGVTETIAGLPIVLASAFLSSAKLLITVTAPTLTGVNVAPNPVSLSSGQQQIFTATPSCSPSSCPSEGISYAWSLSTSSLGTLAPSSSGTTSTLTAGSSAASGNVQVTATFNGATLQGSASVTVTVSTPPPTITQLTASPNPDTVGNQFQVTASVSGTGAITYSWSGYPSDCSPSSSQASWACSPGTGDGGSTFTIQLVASDASGSSAPSTVQLQVSTQSSSLTGVSISPPSPSVNTGGQVSFTATPTCSPGSCPGGVTYSWQLLNSALGTLSGTAGSTTTLYAGSSAASGQLEVTASLNGASLSGYASVTVTSSTPKPVINSFTGTPMVGGTVTVDIYGTLTLSVSVSGTGLTYSYAGLPLGCPNQNSATLTCSPNSGGPTSITVTVSNPGGSAQQSLFVQINNPPYITSIGASPNPVTQYGSSTVSVSAGAGTPPLTYTWSALPAGCSSVNAASFSCTPSSSGSFGVKVVVSDPTGMTTSDVLTLIVNAYVDPTVSNVVISPNPVYVGSQLSISSTVTGGLPPYTLSYTGLPDGCSSSNSDPYTCIPSAVGTSTLDVRVTDSKGISAVDGGFTLSVKSACAAPTLSVSWTDNGVGAVTYNGLASPGGGGSCSITGISWVVEGGSPVSHFFPYSVTFTFCSTTITTSVTARQSDGQVSNTVSFNNIQNCNSGASGSAVPLSLGLQVLSSPLYALHPNAPQLAAPTSPTINPSTLTSKRGSEL